MEQRFAFDHIRVVGAMADCERADQRRKVCTEAMAKYFCQVVGIEPIDNADGSANWWIFVNEAGEIYDGLLARFPAMVPKRSQDAAVMRATAQTGVLRRPIFGPSTEG